MMARTLESFEGDAQAHTRDFFQAWMADLTPADAEKGMAICDKLVTDLGRTRFSSLFKLPASQVDTLIRENGGGEGWRMTIEAIAGFSFKEPTVPRSADLFNGIGPTATVMECTVPVASTNHASMSISRTLTAQGKFLDEVLPEYCFDVVKTKDPMNNEIKETDIEAFTNSVLQYAFTKYGAWNFGMPLARLFGKQAHARLRILPTKGKVVGCKRDFGQMLYDKSRNRQFVCCPPPPQHSPLRALSLPMHHSRTPCTNVAEGIQDATFHQQRRCHDDRQGNSQR